MTRCATLYWLLAVTLAEPLFSDDSKSLERQLQGSDGICRAVTVLSGQKLAECQCQRLGSNIVRIQCAPDCEECLSNTASGLCWRRKHLAFYRYNASSTIQPFLKVNRSDCVTYTQELSDTVCAQIEYSNNFVGKPYLFVNDQRCNEFVPRLMGSGCQADSSVPGLATPYANCSNLGQGFVVDLCSAQEVSNSSLLALYEPRHPCLDRRSAETYCPTLRDEADFSAYVNSFACDCQRLGNIILAQCPPLNCQVCDGDVCYQPGIETASVTMNASSFLQGQRFFGYKKTQCWTFANGNTTNVCLTESGAGQLTLNMGSETCREVERCDNGRYYLDCTNVPGIDEVLNYCNGTSVKAPPMLAVFDPDFDNSECVITKPGTSSAPQGGSGRWASVVLLVCGWLFV